MPNNIGNYPESFMGRVKSMAGGFIPPQIPSATALNLPNTTNIVDVTGTTAVVSILGTEMPGRTVTFISSDSTGALFTNDDTPVAGEMNLGGEDFTVKDDTTLTLVQLSDGTWLKTVPFVPEAV